MYREETFRPYFSKTYVAERIFQLEPEPPTVDSLNEYILSALQEKDLIYFSFFLHHYEPQLNKRIKDFLGMDGGDLYDTDRFIDIKLSCREQMLQKLMDYDLAKGAEYATYIFPFIRDAMLRFRMGEEKWSVSSLTNYKMVRSMAWLYHNYCSKAYGHIVSLGKFIDLLKPLFLHRSVQYHIQVPQASAQRSYSQHRLAF